MGYQVCDTRASSVRKLAGARLLIRIKKIEWYIECLILSLSLGEQSEAESKLPNDTILKLLDLWQ